MMQALAIEQLVKTYDNGYQALKSIDLTVEQGDFFGLLGPNGAGKTTLIGILSSLVNKTSGQVKIMGTNIDDNFTLAKSHLGVVPQEFNFSIFEPVQQSILEAAGYYGIPRKEARVRVEALFKRLDLWDKRDNQIRYLSGGMKRRLMIVRALITRPDILILDEPTAGVDIELRRSMWEFLAEINRQGTTVILTTHYLEEAEALCKNIAIINHGEIVTKAETKSLIHQLASETFILDLVNRHDVLPQVTDVAFHLLDEQSMEMEVKKGHCLNDIFAALSTQGFQVASMRNKSNRLEELFLRLVSESNAHE